MRNKSKPFLFFLSLISISGCTATINKNLSPSSQTKWVNIEIKNPSIYTKPFPLEVRYISHKCIKKRINGFDGSVITEPSYNVIKTPVQQQNDSIWRGKVAMAGGGSCNWTLSAVTLGIEYIDATHLGKDLVPGTAVGATIAFDNDASRNGKYILVQGDINISPVYYPYIRRWRLIRNENELTLLGKEDFIFYRASNTGKISFSPQIDESGVVEYIEPMEKNAQTYPMVKYPDGSVVFEKDFLPDFERVNKIKEN